MKLNNETENIASRVEVKEKLVFERRLATFATLSELELLKLRQVALWKENKKLRLMSYFSNVEELWCTWGICLAGHILHRKMNSLLINLESIRWLRISIN